MFKAPAKKAATRGRRISRRSWRSEAISALLTQCTEKKNCPPLAESPDGTVPDHDFWARWDLAFRSTGLPIERLATTSTLRNSASNTTQSIPSEIWLAPLGSRRVALRGIAKGEYVFAAIACV